MILVTGATGNIGSDLVRLLIKANTDVRALSRDAAKAQAHLGDTVQVIAGDLEKPETLGPAFDGAEKAFVLATGPSLPQLVGNAVRAAGAAGVKHVVLLSAEAAGTQPLVQIGRWHLQAEESLKASGLAWTMLRPGAFASNALQWARSIKAQGVVVHATGDGKAAPIDPRDIAAVAAKVLTSPGHEGKVYTLSGGETMTMADQVRVLGDVIGKPLRCIDVPVEQAREGLVKAGQPEVMANAVAELLALLRSRGGWPATGTVEALLGRKPRTFRDWATDHAAAFQ